ncbi:MAG: OmpA family protein [Deltaproteobacteria bacterium]|nr:MAG: OmpA family protein [Deltaproteobacteria bacterium]
MSAYRILPLILVVAVGCAKPLPERSPLAVSPLELGEDEWRVTEQVIVITDASGTMYANETFPEAKALTRSFVASMPDADARAANPDSYRVGAVGFGGDDRIVAPLDAFDRSTLAATTQDLEIMGSIDGMGGPTPLHAVLAEVGEALMQAQGRTALVIFSDGLPDFPERSIGIATALVEGYRGELCIHTIQTGDDPAGRDFLTELAGVSPCGSARAAQTVADASSLTAFTRSVFAASAPPPVAAPAAVPDPCAGVVRLQGIEFGFDRDEVTSDSAVVLDVAAEILQDCAQLDVQIHGHTDWTGPEEYNQGLSERRAESVKRYFIGTGVEERRLSAQGFGESDPVAPNDTRDGRARNRRVELKPIAD